MPKTSRKLKSRPFSFFCHTILHQNNKNCNLILTFDKLNYRAEHPFCEKSRKMFQFLLSCCMRVQEEESKWPKVCKSLVWYSIDREDQENESGFLCKKHFFVEKTVGSRNGLPRYQLTFSS